MTRPPDYIRHQVSEDDVTIDWFFARGHPLRRLRQFGLILVGWVFEILPIAITVSALAYRHDPQAPGWWHYVEGFYMWDVTTWTLKYLIVAFLIVFLVLYLINRASAGRRRRRRTYDATRLDRRLAIAADMYRGKYGSEAFRHERKKVVIEPYVDIETYELRDLYRRYGVD